MLSLKSIHPPCSLSLDPSLQPQLLRSDMGHFHASQIWHWRNTSNKLVSHKGSSQPLIRHMQVQAGALVALMCCQGYLGILSGQIHWGASGETSAWVVTGSLCGLLCPVAISPLPPSTCEAPFCTQCLLTSQDLQSQSWTKELRPPANEQQDSSGTSTLGHICPCAL